MDGNPSRGIEREREEEMEWRGWMDGCTER